MASVLEEVVAPIPSALVMMASGFIFISGPVNTLNIIKLVFLVALPAAIGVTLGSYVIYGLSWWGGRQVLDKWGKWIGLYWSDVEKLEERLKRTKKDEIGVVIARVIPIVPSVAVSAFCGFVRMPVFRYTLTTFVGMFIRSIIIASVGWQVGNVYYRYAGFVSKFENYILISVFVLILIFALNLFLRSRGLLAQKDREV